jgi:hypothetical protein
VAIVNRYFSTSSAGAADGTSWANRAVLFSGGVWSTVLTQFAGFAGSDSLVALIGPGSYAITANLVSSSFTGVGGTAPTAANPLILHGCDSSGNALAPPDPDWTSDQPAWDASGLPSLESSTNISIVNLTNCVCRLLSFIGSGNTTNSVIASNTSSVDWCSIACSSSHTSASGVGSISSLTNSVVTMSGTAYNVAASALDVLNSRLAGNASASSGNRYGWSSTTAQPTLRGSTFLNHPGGGIVSTASSTAFLLTAIHNTITNNGGDGITLTSTASQTAICRILHNYIANNGGYGINAASSRALCFRNRLRDNTSGNLNSFSNYPTTLDNYTTDSDDATEFANSGSGDYRIKSGSAISGSGYGVSDQPAAGGSSIFLPRGMFGGFAG